MTQTDKAKATDAQLPPPQTLQQLIEKSAKEFKWEVGGYFPTLDTLLQDYVINTPSHKNQAEIKSLQDVVDVIREAEARIVKLIHN